MEIFARGPAAGTSAAAPSSAAPTTDASSIEATLDSWGVLIPEHGDHESNVPLGYPKHRELLLPSYVAFVVKSLRNIDAHDQTIDVSCTLVVRIDFGDMPPSVRDECIRKIAFRFNEAPLQVDPEHVRPPLRPRATEPASGADRPNEVAASLHACARRWTPSGAAHCT